MAKPEIRLKGFDGEWKECSFSKVILVNSGKDYKHLKPGVIPVYGTGGYMLSVDRSISDKDAIGIGRKGTIDAPQLLKAPFWTIDTLFFMTVKDDYSLDFIYSLCQTINWRMHDESTGVPSLSKNNIEKIGVFVPDSLEQQAIADYFKSLDSMLQSTTKKIVSLKQMKQACLVSMFPQAGETTPRVRFKGFEGKWGYSSLGEIFEERVESNIYGEMLSVTMNNGVIKASENGRFDNSNSDKSKYKVVKVNDIAYNSMRMWQGASGCSQYEGIVSPAYTVVVPCEGIDSLFFSYMFKTLPMITLFRLHSQGLTSDTWNLKYPAFSKIKVIYPKEIQEQQRIASYFRSLDKQISLQEKRLEKLKQIKAACLDKMFV